MPNKEQVYDDQINPLMAEIIGICQRHGIAMVCSFHIPNDEDADLQATTVLPDETGKNYKGHLPIVRFLRLTTNIGEAVNLLKN